MGGRKGEVPGGRAFRRVCWMCHECAELDFVGEHEHTHGEMVLRKRGWRYFLYARGPMICPVCAQRRTDQNAEITPAQLNVDLEDLPF
jgi:hypothetical protein